MAIATAGDPDDFDYLVEQQDQEFIRDGVISPATRARMKAYIEGKPLKHAANTPAMQAHTARLLQKSRLRQLRGDWQEDEVFLEDDDEWSGEDD